jgi:hypothetical protein
VRNHVDDLASHINALLSDRNHMDGFEPHAECGIHGQHGHTNEQRRQRELQLHARIVTDGLDLGGIGPDMLML